jgi:hypothetical protein
VITFDPLEFCFCAKKTLREAFQDRHTFVELRGYEGW